MLSSGARRLWRASASLALGSLRRLRKLTGRGAAESAGWGVRVKLLVTSPDQAIVRARRYLSRVERVKRKKRRFVKAAASMTPYLVADKLGSHFVLPV